MRSPLSESGRASHDCILSRESTTGRAAWKAALRKPMQGPTFATSFFLAQAELALKGAKDGAPAKQGRPEKPQVSRRERHGGTPELQRTARRCRADPSLLSLGTSGRRYKTQCEDPPSRLLF